MVMVIPDQLIYVRIALNDLARVSSQQHANVRIGEKSPQGGKQGEREDNVAKAVGADYQDSLYGLRRIDSM